MKLRSFQNGIALLTVVLIYFSFSGQHPVGRTGAPGDGLCSNCHGGGNFSGSISLDGVSGTSTPGEVLNLTLEIEAGSGSPVQGGFQVLALDDSNDPAGIMSSPGAGSSILPGSGGRMYWGHAPAQAFSGNTVDWTADWEVPSINADVTFYFIGVLGNGGGSGGDQVVVSELTTTVMATAALELDFADINGVNCFGDANGSATVLITGGTEPYNIEWDSGETTETATMLEGGMQGVTVTDADDNMVSGSVDIPSPDEIMSNSEIVNISCFGESDGSITIVATGGTGDLNCAWDRLGDECAVSNLEGGTYFVTISDENGCVLVEEFTIREPTMIEFDIDVMDATSAGDDGSITVAPFGGISSTYEFNWSNGFNEEGEESTIAFLEPGDYDVTITDENNCEVIASATVGGTSCSLDATSVANDVLCYGESNGSISLDITGNQNSPTYEWSTGDTSPALLDVPAGSYDVTVTDSPGCSTVLSGIVIGEPDSLVANILVLVNPACDGANNGRIVLGTGGGVQGYDLQWSNGAVNDTIIMGMDTIISIPDTLENLAVGTYAYTLTDANSCSIIDSVELNNSDLLPPTIMLIQGTVLLDENGFAPAADFSLVDNGTFDNCEISNIIFDTGNFTCSDIGIQSYQVVVNDANGNISVDTATIVVEEQISPTITCPDPLSVVIECGIVQYEDATAIDNCAVSSIGVISGPQSGESVPLGVSTVIFQAVDDCGNSSDCAIEINNIEEPISLMTNVTDASCSENNGSIALEVDGGTPPYTITPVDLDSLGAGDVTITVVDSLGCVYNEVVTVNQANNDLEVIIATVDIPCPGDTSGMVAVEVTGGSGDYTIEYPSGIDTMALASGDYSVTITDNADGCTTEQTFTIVEPDPAEITVTEVVTDPCTGLIMDVNVDVVGGQPPFMGSAEVVGEIFTLTLVDANGCEYQETLIQNLVETLLQIDDAVVVDTDDSVNGSIDISVLGGVAPYSYVWTDNLGDTLSIGEDIFDLGVGDYTVIITDQAGCIITAEYTVDMVSSIDDLGSFEINIAPHPVVDYLNIEFGDVVPDKVQLMDITGRVIQSVDEVNSSLSLDMSSYTSGLYLLRVVDLENRNELRKVIKQ